VTLVVLAVAAPGLYFWHRFSVQSLDDDLLVQAGRFEEAGKWSKAADYVYRYLQLNPDSAEQWKHLAESYDKSAQTENRKARAVQHFGTALALAERPQVRGGLAPDVVDKMRCRRAQLLIDIGALDPSRFQKAEQEVRKVRAYKPDAPPKQEPLAAKNYAQAWKQLAISRYAQVRNGLADKPAAAPEKPAVADTAKRRSPDEMSTVGEEADRLGMTLDLLFERARTLNPADVPLSVLLASLYRERRQQDFLSDSLRGKTTAECMKLADQVMDDLVANAATVAEAYLARYYYHQQFSPDDSVPPASSDATAVIGDPDLRKALELEPKSVRVHFAVANHLQRIAIRISRAADRKAARDEYLQEAVRQYDLILNSEPDNELAYLELGSLYFRKGDIDTALKTWKRGTAHPANEASLPLWQQIVRGYLAKNSFAEAREATAQLNSAIKQVSPKLERESRTQLRREQQLMQARFSFAERNYAAATSQLEDFVTKERPTENFLADAQRMLFQGYVALQRWEEAVAAFRSAAQASDSDPASLIAAAQSLVTLGHPAEALQCYGILLAIPALEATQRAELKFLAAEAGFMQQSALPPDQRSWTVVKSDLAEIETSDLRKILGQPWRVDLLAVGVEIMSQPAGAPADTAKRDQWLARLRAAESKPQPSAPMWRQLALMYQQLNSPEDSDRAAGQFVAIADAAGSPVPGLLLRSGLLSLRGHKDEARQLFEKAAADTSLSADDQRTIQRGLANLDRSSGGSRSAQQRLVKIVAADDKAGPDAIAEIIELSLDINDLPSAEQWENKLRAMGGDNTILADYYQARRLLAGAGGTNAAAIAAAQTLQAKLVKERPNWPPAHVLQSLILQRSGKTEEAVSAMRQAIAFGDRSAGTYQRLIMLLFEAGRGEDAEACLKEFRSRGAGASDASSLLELIVAAGLGNVGQTLQAAQRRAEQNPQDGTAQLALGYILLSAEKPKEAEAAFRKAVTLEPKNVRTHEGLFSYCLRSKQPDRALESLQALEKQAELTDVQRKFVMSQGYARLADLSEPPKRSEYRKMSVALSREAHKLDPNWSAVPLFLADQLMRDETTLSEAEGLLRDMLKQGVEPQQSRWMLANLLAAAPNRARFQEALQLLDQAGGDPTESDRRMKTDMLLRSGGEQNLAEARRNLEAMMNTAARPADADRLLLAQICESTGDVPAALQQYKALVDTDRPAAAHIAPYVELLINTGNTAEADKWLKQLEQRNPDAAETVGLRALLLNREGQAAKVEPLVESYAAKQLEQLKDYPRRRAELAGMLGRLYTQLDLFAAAQRWYAYLVKIEPAGYSELALSLARQGDAKGAINLCLEASRTDSSPVPVAALASALLQSKPTPEDYELAEPLLADAEKKFPDNSELLFLIGTVRYVQQKYEACIALYQRVIQLTPNHVLALNNLANVVGEQLGKSDEALKYVEQALSYASPQASPFLWDTKAMILLREQQADKAIPLLEKATSVPRPDPRHQFHLAVAYLKMGQDDKARAAFDLAEQGKFDRDILTPADQKMLADLRKSLPPKKG
jgi:Flp pilus assembly protein TadD